MRTIYSIVSCSYNSVPFPCIRGSRFGIYGQSDTLKGYVLTLQRFEELL